MAADSGIFLHWQRPIAGRETQALELFNNLTGYLGKQQQLGNIESYEPILIAPHGYELGGYVLARGNRQAIDKLAMSDDFQNLMTQAMLMFKSFGVDHAYVGEGFKIQMARYQRYAPQAKFEIK
jgi:hypothetical protein